MPYRIDEAEHFSRITNAAIRVLDRGGLAGLTWLAVAREGEMSVSAVRHRCDLEHDRLVQLVVIALRRARVDRVERTCGPAWAAATTLGVDPRARALALLPRTPTDCADVRVTAMLRADPGLPEGAAGLLRRQRDDDRAWALALMRGDKAAAALLDVTVAGLALAVADREDPLELVVAEHLLSPLLAGGESPGRHALDALADRAS